MRLIAATPRDVDQRVGQGGFGDECAWLLPRNLPERLKSPPSPVSPPILHTPRLASDANLSLKQAIRGLEQSYIRAARDAPGAAGVLEISPRALLYKIKEYGIDVDAEGGRG